MENCSFPFSFHHAKPMCKRAARIPKGMESGRRSYFCRRAERQKMRPRPRLGQLLVQPKHHASAACCPATLPLHSL